MTGKRSRLITIAAAGTLAAAAAVSAAVAALPSGPAAASAAMADTHLTIVNHNQVAPRVVRSATLTAAQSLPLSYRVRFILGEHQRAHQAAVTKAAKAAAARAAARRAAAARAAAAREAAQQAAAQQAAQQASATQSAVQQPAPATQQPGTQQATVTAASGSPQQVAEQMLSQFGWSAGQFSCLQPLWAQESGWSVTAENPSSGAYGIPQALPGSKMASAGADWQTDAATQIRWGLTYIQGTYGSPCGAWAHEQADGWY
jgi:hypothetical protein